MLLHELSESALDLERPNIHSHIESFLEAAQADARNGNTDNLSYFMQSLEKELGAEMDADTEDYLTELLNFTEGLVTNGKIHIGGYYAGSEGYDLAAFDRVNIDKMANTVYKWIEDSIQSSHYERQQDL